MASLRPYSPSPSANLSIPGTPNHVIQSHDGYKDVIFAGKKAQASKVEESIKDAGFMPEALIKNEVAWFYNNLGIDDTYFKMESVETIAEHITSLWGAKVIAYAKHQDTLEVKLETETADSAVFIHTSAPGTSLDGVTYEQLIDDKYLDPSNKNRAYRLETYRSSGNVSSSLSQQLRCYFLSPCNWVDGALEVPEGENDITKVSDKTFLEKVSSNTLQIYQALMNQALERSGPVVDMFSVEGKREKRLVIAFKQNTSSRFFSGLSHLYHFYGTYSTRKYVEQFANGITIISIYLNPLRGPPIENSIYQIMKEVSLVYCFPNNPFFNPTSGHSVQEAAYAMCGFVFATHFLNRLGASYSVLRNFLDESDPGQAAVLADIRSRFREETFTRQTVQDVLSSYPEIVKLAYVQFANVHHFFSSSNSSSDGQIPQTLSYQRISQTPVLSEEELAKQIVKVAANKHHAQILSSLIIFNNAILKTNFFTPTKVALSFRLSGQFLPESEYATKPFGICFVVGSDFRGFHLRFKDVARGGIRIIRSRTAENYSANLRNLFDENYALAATQALKNKDIPEGGSKGTILPEMSASPRICFEKYVDAILDLLLKGNSPGIKEEIVDLYGKDEILFFGPDEGTADLMDWAAQHARSRGASWWKSFTTGKSAEKLGGVPHDLFGMTSLSVRQYSTGIYRELGLKETEITKVQTGGPDGDLGSNEILLSKDKTITIIDGSGVLHDPLGINREELTRLAKARKMISFFDTSKLSKDGYRVLCEDNDVTLPSGEKVYDGTSFRNTAHLRYKADILVPCGGRPEAVNISNVHEMWNDEGIPRYKYIVEGANLFITQQARLLLEKKGVILFKDSAANKGGVTSSSLEVLCGLVLKDDEYVDLMTSMGGEGFSDFYIAYVRAIQDTIIKNAATEFDCIWKESKKGSKPRCILVDEIGRTLINLQNELEESDLFDDVVARRAVMSAALPKPLLEQVGLDECLNRLPVPYQHSLFSSYIASKYIYEFGITASQVDFFHFFSRFRK